jgi:integrase
MACGSEALAFSSEKVQRVLAGDRGFSPNEDHDVNLDPRNIRVALEMRSIQLGNPAGPILRNSFGEPWTGDGFRTSWDKTFKRAGLGDDDLHFHDLRGTAVTRLALSGCTVPEIAAITGHSPRDVEAILEAHYLGGRVELAEQAMMKLDARYGNGT